MSLHERHHTTFQSVEKVHNPLTDPDIAPRKARGLLRHYGPVAVIVFGVVIVTPAWIGLLGWVALNLLGWLVGT